MKKLVAFSLLFLTLTGGLAQASTYKIDDNTMGTHAFVQFRVKHLGYSWLYGNFKKFSGSFVYDSTKPEASSIKMLVDLTSLDSNHAERDKHIRSDDFLDVKKYPQASFESTSFNPTATGGLLKGNLSFFGKVAPIEVNVTAIGGGKDPWGGERQGFEGSATIKPSDFGLDLTKKLGPSTATVELIIAVEGIKQ